MNIQSKNILMTIRKNGYVNQRLLSEQSGCSLGMVNKAIKNLCAEGMLDFGYSLTNKAKNEFNIKKPYNAIILAESIGMRMLPSNIEVSKAMLEVKGERLIERQIRQLHEKGISDITVIVGFMKEQFEYLIDKYGVDIVVNSEYSIKNNLYSIEKVLDLIHNTYIIPCDIWCKENPFNEYELYSWYMMSDASDDHAMVRVNRKLELVRSDDGIVGNKMVGISYLSNSDQLCLFKNRIKELSSQKRDFKMHWEEALFVKDRCIIHARVVPDTDVVEINNYEQWIELDTDSQLIMTGAIKIIAGALGCKSSDVSNIEVMKAGMTNRSYIFSVRKGDSSSKYILRIPGEGTSQLIDREAEYRVYKTIEGLGFCDEPVYINPNNGYKITRYINGARCCDPYCENDLVLCMEKLRDFHNCRINDNKLVVPHSFDLLERLEFYEGLWEGNSSVYGDYENTKHNCITLMPFIEKHRGEMQLTHIDAVPDNFIFDSKGNIQLTDWEYAGMQDKDVDIAMFCIYSLYDRQHIDRLIDIYFEEDCECEITTRAKIYAYISICGLIWSNWCEFKRNLGVEFGEYSLYQYRYAKDYYKYAKELIDKCGEKLV